MRIIKILLGAIVVLAIVVLGLPKSDDPAWASTRIADVVWKTSNQTWISDEIETPLTLAEIAAVLPRS